MRKNLKILDVEQGSEAWLKAREGILTASKISGCITAKTKKVSESKIDSVARELVADVLKFEEPVVSNYWMDRGNKLEKDAAEILEFGIGAKLLEVGLIIDEKRKIGCSPDRLLEGRDIGVEIKCPKCSTHLGYLRDKKIPDEYELQVQYSMYVTGFDEWVFCSYYPELNPLVLWVKKDPEIHKQIDKVLELLNEKITEYKELAKG